MVRNWTLGAGLALAAGTAAGQDAQFSVNRTSEPGLYVVAAEFFGTAPAGTALDVVWGNAQFRLSGTEPITFDGYNPGYRTPVFGDPTFAGDGTTEATFEGVMLGTDVASLLGGTPDTSNPLLVASFRYDGDLIGLDFDLVGQNSVVFTGDAAGPFGILELYLDANNQAGTRTFSTSVRFNVVPVEDIAFFIPSPSTLALAPIALVAARRRRK